ncbi:MAG: NAD-dependent succinate-semialdehyde dehydrogenase [Armatimonadetes bacterium]|nr:NAD-dependent succinate-semialdehyde dehydrogenase [Armatimonadota bacterium]MDW8122138.1 NAD-dependent succinate-semialdehyde dehydrogenase [Armatimonadota bacterium]
MVAAEVPVPKDAFQMFVGGKWTNGSAKEHRPIINPATEETIVEVPEGTREDAQAAIDAAVRAFSEWSRLTPYDRAPLLKKAADLIRDRKSDIARLMTLEVGKPIKESEVEVEICAGYFEWYAEEAKRNYGDIVPPWIKSKRHWLIRQPVGVVATITPWNFPANLLARKVAPALAAGCTVVSKPDHRTPLTAMAIFHCLDDAGLPPGVANLITGDPNVVCQPFFTDPRVRKVTFTGSTRVGRLLMQQAADQIKRLSLELGGHAPVLVFPDVDVAAAALWTVRAKFRNNGQTCISPNRIYVHQNIWDAFVDQVVEFTKQLKLGNGLNPETDVGPLFSREGREKVERHTQDALSKGATLLLGGRRPDGKEFEKGFWYLPTVLTDVTKDMVITCEETFGPVMPLFPFEDTDQVIAEANDSPAGLASYVLTNDLKTVIEVSERLETGMVGVWDFAPATFQCPFGGVKESGFGLEGGWEGLKEFLVTKHISINLG